MTSATVSTRLRFLNESSHLLSRSSPTISSFLQHQVDHVLHQNNLVPSELRRAETCGACGTFSEYSAPNREIVKDRSTKKNRAKGKAVQCSLSPKKTLVLSCKKCNAKTRLAVPGNKPARLNAKPAKAKAHPIIVAEKKEESREASSPAPAGLKKRRPKKGTSLKAMLAKSKETNQQSSGLGLALIDFMQTG
jgi:RNAse P Rpr2/Rpp21/SNM1 subunit domain